MQCGKQAFNPLKGGRKPFINLNFAMFNKNIRLHIKVGNVGMYI